MEQKLFDIENWLSFALTHCVSQHIEEILLQKLDVERARLALANVCTEVEHRFDQVIIFFKA